MMMALDQFVFGLNSLAYQELQRQTQWKHRASSRINARDAFQFTGPGDDTITLTGILAPELTGSLISLQDVRDMGDDGLPYVMVDGNGLVYGTFIVESLSENQTLHDPFGVPRRIEFTINLTRVDEELVRAQDEEEESSEDDEISISEE